jgi:hypothetical protein
MVNKTTAAQMSIGDKFFLETSDVDAHRDIANYSLQKLSNFPSEGKIFGDASSFIIPITIRPIIKRCEKEIDCPPSDVATTKKWLLAYRFLNSLTIEPMVSAKILHLLQAQVSLYGSLPRYWCHSLRVRFLFARLVASSITQFSLIRLNLTVSPLTDQYMRQIWAEIVHKITSQAQSAVMIYPRHPPCEILAFFTDKTIMSLRIGLMPEECKT